MRKSIFMLMLAVFSIPVWSQTNSQEPAKSDAQETAKAPATCDANPTELIKLTAEHDVINDLRARNYTYKQRTETHELNKDGSVKKTESETAEEFVLFGKDVERRIAKNDQPLSEKDAKKEEEKIQKIIDKYSNESVADRRKREAEYDKNTEEDRKFVREVTEAFNFKLLPEETVNERTSCVYDFEPRPGFKPTVKFADKLEKVRGRLWIDKEEKQWSRVDVDVLDTISFGLFLARIHKGSNFHLEQIKVNDDIWLPKKVDVKVDVRALIFVSANVDVGVVYSDYRKFTSSSKITMVGEIEEPKKDESIKKYK